MPGSDDGMCHLICAGSAVPDIRDRLDQSRLAFGNLENACLLLPWMFHWAFEPYPLEKAATGIRVANEHHARIMMPRLATPR